MSSWNRVLIGDATDRLRDLPDASVDTVITSPPYFRLRNYDVAARIDEGRYVALLLDADNHHASTVAYRIKADIQVQIPGAGKWRAGTATT